MSTWRTIRPFLAVLIVGILLGVIGALLLDNDDEPKDVGEGAVTTTEAPATDPPTTSSTTSSTSTSTSSTTTSTTTSTSTTTLSSGPAPLADATNGDLVGFAMGSPMEAVEVQLVSLYGAPANDTGWSTGCPLDGNADLDERLVGWGDLRVRFALVDGAEVVGGWVFGDPTPGPTPPPSPDGTGIVMPPGVAWGQSIAEVAVAIGVPTDGVADVQETFLLTWIYDDAGEARWLAPGVDLGTPFTEVSWRPDDICD